MPLVLHLSPHPHTPRAYKELIDRSGGNGDNDYRFDVSSELSDFLKPSKGRKKNGPVARLQRRKGSDGSGKQATADANESHPLVLERRKQPDLPAAAEHQVREFQALAQRLLELREQEHQELSRELHDNIAQVLSAATARISLARQETIPAWLRQELLDLMEELRTALDDVRTLARDLRPCVLDHLGFAAALQKHAEAFRERTHMKLEICVVPEAVGFLANGDLTHLFRLAQEALQNIEEHSGAKHAWINLWQRDGTMLLEIGDDGCAFTPDRVVEAQNNGHLGLLGMRERAELLGGEFVLQAVPGEGTVINITIPPPGKTCDVNTVEFRI